MQTHLFQLHADIEDRHWWFVGRRRIMRKLVQAVLPPSRNKQIVDVGCGTGANIASLSDTYDCVGVDTSSDAIAAAKQRYPGVAFRLGAAPEALGEIARRADMFLCMDVLEHIENDRDAFASIVAPMKAGALFLITVPADMALWSGHDEAFGHFRRYEPDSLRRLWSQQPVSEMLLSHFSSRLYPVVRAVRSVTRLRGKPFGAGGTDFRIPAAPINHALTRLFSGEATRIDAALNGRAAPYRFGSSLVALLRRDAT
jgi:SAM-dependent methyltransferase